MANRSWMINGVQIFEEDQTPAAVAAGAAITVRRGDSLSIAITGLGDISNASRIWFSAKKTYAQVDGSAQLMVENPGGLQTVVGRNPTTGETATLIVDDPIAGDITVEVSAAASEDLAVFTGVYDVQVLRSTGKINTLATGSFTVSDDVTREIS